MGEHLQRLMDAQEQLTGGLQELREGLRAEVECRREGQSKLAVSVDQLHALTTKVVGIVEQQRTARPGEVVPSAFTAAVANSAIKAARRLCTDEQPIPGSPATACQGGLRVVSPPRSPPQFGH